MSDDFLVRHHLPALLEASGLRGAAEALRGLRVIAGRDSGLAAGPALYRALDAVNEAMAGGTPMDDRHASLWTARQAIIRSAYRVAL